jgi:hypothetical protein
VRVVFTRALGKDRYRDAVLAARVPSTPEQF